MSHFPTTTSSLSGRERDVLQRIAAGDSNKVIARALGLSPHTVKRHVSNILDKLDLSTRAKAAVWWLTGSAGWPQNFLRTTAASASTPPSPRVPART